MQIQLVHFLHQLLLTGKKIDFFTIYSKLIRLLLYICSMNNTIDILKGTPPGKIIEHDLAKKHISQITLAEKSGVSKQMINAIIAGRRDLSVELSLRIEKALDYDEGFLLHLQTYYKIKKTKAQQSKEKYKSAPNLRKSLFWDTDFDSIDWDRYQKAVIHRVLERGTEAEKREIARFYSIPRHDLEKYALPEKQYKPRGAK